MKTTFFFLIAMLLSAHAQAHGGRTNAQGCHNDNKSGGYHCHGGGSSTSSRSGVMPKNLAPASSTTSGSDGSIPYDFYTCVDEIHELAQILTPTLVRNTPQEYAVRLRDESSSQLVICYASHRKKVIEE